MAAIISIDDALMLIDQSTHRLPTETVTLDDAVGRRLAEDLRSDVDSPPHDKSLMDGYVVHSSDLAAGVRRFEIVETVAAGDVPAKQLQGLQAARVMTGAPIPSGGDAVVMRELLTRQWSDAGTDWIELATEPLPVGHHILRRGASMTCGELVFRAGHTIRSADIGVMAEMGCRFVEVVARPSLSILATGNELVAHDQVDPHHADANPRRGALPPAGHIRNSNGPLLKALAEPHARSVISLGIACDRREELAAKCQIGLHHEVLVLSGGVSEGIFDLVPSVLTSLGVQCVFHKVAIKPGKPIWFGVGQVNGSRRYVFGLPGNPLSTLVCFEVFVGACLRKLSGGQAGWPPFETARLATPHQVRGRPTFWPARTCASEGAARVVAPLIWQGSSDLRCLADADCLIYADPREAAYGEGTEVKCYRLY